MSQCRLLVRTPPAVLVGKLGDDQVGGGMVDRLHETLLGPPPVVGLQLCGGWVGVGMVEQFCEAHLVSPSAVDLQLHGLEDQCLT